MTRDLTDFEKEVQQHIVEILKDTVDDGKKIIKRLQATIVLLVILLVCTFVYYEWNFKNFLQQYDYENTITTTTTTKADTNNNVDTKNSSNTNSSNNINVTIPDIKTNSKK